MESSRRKILPPSTPAQPRGLSRVDFWFNHFNVFAGKGPDRTTSTEYERDAIRPHVLGRFRDLLGATAKSPAMLFYLDNWLSADPKAPSQRRLRQRRARASGRRASAPARMGATPQRAEPAAAARLNENYARELMELHTLGVDGGYTQQDVVEVARAFTGWTIGGPRQGGGFRFDAAPARPRRQESARHDDRRRRRHRGRRARPRHRRGASVDRAASSRPSWRGASSPTSRRRRWSIAPPRVHADRRRPARGRRTILVTSPEFFAPSATARR